MVDNEDGYRAATYGDRIAEAYDEMHPLPADAAAERLAELADVGPVLELGVGTGRLALPLAARGIDVGIVTGDGAGGRAGTCRCLGGRRLARRRRSIRRYSASGG